MEMAEAVTMEGEMQIEVFKLPKMGGPDFWGTTDVWQATMTRADQRFDAIFSGPHAEKRARSYVAVWGEALRNNGGLATDFDG